VKLATFQASGSTSWGIVLEDSIADVGSVLLERYSELKAVIAANAWDEVRGAISLAPTHSVTDVNWLPTIPDPDKILCIGLNYETHREETGRDKTAYPAVFTRFADTQIGHLAPIIRPRVSTILDYEGELAIIIGKSGRYIDPADAMSHVAGYCCYNDATVRDWQRHTIQFTPGKNFPGTGALGPMVTPDEVGDYRQLGIETRVNGQTVQSARLNQLIFDIPTLIAYCSSFTPLSPGDIIATGTPGGVGFKRDPQLLLAPGDMVEVEIPGIGLLQNGVADER
jgi:2-keto-4-pentenoate hydratase/2-oxohepta-3-ene-1,7-dioic acid hydratase in catechol pathway